MRGDHGVEDLGDGALLGLGERLNLLQLLLQLRRRPALAGGAPGGRADQFFDGHLQHAGDGGQRRRGDEGGADFVMRHRLLRDAQLLGQVGLGEAERLASRCDLAAELPVEIRVLHGGCAGVGGVIEHKAGSGWQRLTIPVIWVLCVRVVFTQNPLTGFLPGGPPMPQSPDPSPAVSTSLSPVPPASPSLEVVNADEVRFERGPRHYRVRGLARCLSAESLKVTLRLSMGDRLHLDTLDLYQARGRNAFARAAAQELGTTEAIIAADLSALVLALVLALEPVQDAAIRGALAPDEAAAEPALTPEAEAAGLALLRDPGLAERIVRDVEAVGVIGEGVNALVGYLAMVSRLLDRPLAVLIQSTSAAGKSTLMDALLSLLPDGQRVHYSAMTGQPLFYLGEKDLKHKVLAIAEEEGVRQAA